MRTIKFRAWDSDDKEMYEPMVLAVVDNGSLSLSPLRNCKDGNRAYKPYHPLMQFTGLHDNNGKEIYEGDILAFELTKNFNPVYEMPFVMEWDGDNAAWVNFSPKEKIVVIGNIHETPELL